VSFAGEVHEATADQTGKWRVCFDDLGYEGTLKKIVVLVLGVLASLSVSMVLSFSIFRYFPLMFDSLTVFCAILLPVSGSGIGVSFFYYAKGSFRREKKPEVPLLEEDNIFKQISQEVTHDNNGSSPKEPEVIPPGRELVPMEKPQEAIKRVMQNKIISALQNCEVKVSLAGTMDLEGNIENEKIEFSFQPKDPVSLDSKNPAKKPEQRDPERLRRPEI
jgi:hypothetical protein